ncbi:mitochondrial protein [Phaffia rhodozyma]|uniref:Mitochondrial protein n=1 Tax=Phaffia rhodozyma TaxID=264483 RepID=A0A0F7SNQ7_PHARH|nr:mitochondrial protein [Phaffia rhodozyma]
MSNFITHGKKIVAIGRNYKAHALELKNAIPKEPFFFLKPTSSYITHGGTVEIPKGTEVHHEVELGVVIGTGGRDISLTDAMKHVAGYTLAIDMTARNIQDHVKAKGLPWSTAKGFDTFNPISGFIPKDLIENPHDLKLSLSKCINGQTKQDGTTSDMMFQIPRLIEHVSSVMTLEKGDLILTGTPSGVGPIKASDKISCVMKDSAGKEIAQLEVNVKDRDGGYAFSS